MTYRVHELRLAQEDIVSIFDWLNERSPEGAAAWLDAYDAMLNSLQQSAHRHAAAPESERLGEQLRQTLFKTRKGRIYRALFVIEGQDVYILRVRGPGQAPIA